MTERMVYDKSMRERQVKYVIPPSLVKDLKNNIHPDCYSTKKHYVTSLFLFSRYNTYTLAILSTEVWVVLPVIR